jgi:hypothetical protein
MQRCGFKRCIVRSAAATMAYGDQHTHGTGLVVAAALAGCTHVISQEKAREKAGQTYLVARAALDCG